MNSGTATPVKGEWSFKIEQGADNWKDEDEANELLQYIGQQNTLCTAAAE